MVFTKILCILASYVISIKQSMQRPIMMWSCELYVRPKGTAGYTFEINATNVQSIWRSTMQWWFIQGSRHQWVNSHLTKMVTLHTADNDISVHENHGHVGHFRWLGPNVWWENSQISIIYIKPIGQMSDEPWKFFVYIVIWTFCVIVCLFLNI